MIGIVFMVFYMAFVFFIYMDLLLKRYILVSSAFIAVLFGNCAFLILIAEAEVNLFYSIVFIYFISQIVQLPTVIIGSTLTIFLISCIKVIIDISSKNLNVSEIFGHLAAICVFFGILIIKIVNIYKVIFLSFPNNVSSTSVLKRVSLCD